MKFAGQAVLMVLIGLTLALSYHLIVYMGWQDIQAHQFSGIGFILIGIALLLLLVVILYFGKRQLDKFNNRNNYLISNSRRGRTNVQPDFIPSIMSGSSPIDLGDPAPDSADS